jgi:hypothetical protein
METGSDLRFAVSGTAVVMRSKAGGPIGSAAPDVLEKFKGRGLTPVVMDSLKGAIVASIDMADGTVVTLSNLGTAGQLPRDIPLNQAARRMGAANPGITHRVTEFGDTAVQDYALPIEGMPDGLFANRTLFLHRGHLWCIAVFAAIQGRASAAYELATATLTTGS